MLAILAPRPPVLSRGLYQALPSSHDRNYLGSSWQGLPGTVTARPASLSRPKEESSISTARITLLLKHPDFPRNGRLLHATPSADSDFESARSHPGVALGARRPAQPTFPACWLPLANVCLQCWTMASTWPCSTGRTLREFPQTKGVEEFVHIDEMLLARVDPDLPTRLVSARDNYLNCRDRRYWRWTPRPRRHSGQLTASRLRRNGPGAPREGCFKG